MDDILIFSNNWNSHLQQLQLALQTLQESNLSCNPRKTEIGFPEMEYLGYRVSADSLRISEKRIEAIKNISPPKNVKGLQRLLGMLNYWRRYIPYYSKHTYNMRRLLRKDTPFIWTLDCDLELTYLKDCLVKDPILRPLDPNRDIIISTDGSVYGLGWSCMQRDDDGNLYAVNFGSIATTSHQSNYSADDLEALALVYALKSIESFAICRHVTVVTDNSHVLHINKWHPVNPRQRRMLTYIMQFNLTVVFIKGSRNLLADGLSRLFQDASTQQGVDHEARYMHDADDFVLPVTTRSERHISCHDSTDRDSPAVFPVITAADYQTDDEFVNVYNYAMTEQLTGNARVDKTTLLLADRYLIDDGLLYRLDTPRQKKLARLKPIVRRLCVPKRFRHDIIQYVHDHCGHYAAQSLFHTLAARYYWKSLFSDATQFCKTCEICQRTKINFSHRYAPLHPVPVPDELGLRFSMDHKILTRTTNAGNTAVLVLVESFSGFPHLIPVKDTTAETTARAIVNNIIPLWGIFSTLYSDKGPSFVSAVFVYINSLLGIRHVTSVSRSAKSNGQAEAMVKRLVEHLKFYAKDDFSIEEKIPIIEMNLRATAHSKLLISPYEIVFGRCMRLGIPGDPIPLPPDVTPDRVVYYRWLSTELKRLHKAVKESRDELKIEEKAMYDKAKRVIAPSWQIGDRVWLHDDRVRSGSPNVVTRKRFKGPYLIQNIVQGKPNIGTAYQLYDEREGKVLRNLVTNDRLKAHNVDRRDFSERLPRLQTEPLSAPEAINQKTEPTPLEIVYTRKVRDRLQYMVRYTDGIVYPCNWVNDVLSGDYKRRQRNKTCLLYTSPSPRDS